MDPIEKAKQSMGGLEGAISGLPGIKGYREKEMRRDADKLVRDKLAQRLSAVRTRLTDLQNQLLDSGGLAWMDEMEQVGTRLNTVIDRVRTASYGYAGFFDLQRVKEEELDRLVAFDQALADSLPGLDEAVAGLQRAMTANEGLKEAIQAVSDKIVELGQTFGQRSEAMHAAG